MTQTKSFGTSKRENHDASTFYGRSLYSVFPSRPLSESGTENAIPDLNGWVNDIYLGSSADMSVIPDNSIGLAFTSPPYNVGKDYDDDMGFNEYLELIRVVDLSSTLLI